MTKYSRGFQVFVKPTGAVCNMRCQYCYYIEKDQLYPENNSFRMPQDLLEDYIMQHIMASPDEIITFSWHGGEPTLLGIDYFRKIVELQQKHKPKNKTIVNGIQTNGTLLNDEWCSFLANQRFSVGLSLDGPRELHNLFRRKIDGTNSFDQTLRGYHLLKTHGVYTDILSVINAINVKQPLKLYRFFKQLGAKFITFLPLVDHIPIGVSEITVPSEEWGIFLTTVFNEWVAEDIGQIKIQIFEEALRTAFSQEHSLCIFRPTCGNIPVLEHNGDFYSCDHYVEPEHLIGNLKETSLIELLENQSQQFFGEAKQKTLPSDCRECEVLDMCNGGCPKNRFKMSKDGYPNLNYLCSGYKKFFTHCQPFIKEVACIWRQ
jgi:uncharacterized protein